MIDTLLERAKHIPLVVLSFGNETVSLRELEQKLVQQGRETRAIEIPYARLAALSKGEKGGRDRELLVVGWDPEVTARRRDSVQGLGDDLHQSNILDADVGVQADLDLRSSRCALLEASAEPQTGVDQPDAVLGERGLHGDGVGGTRRSARHGSTIPRSGSPSQGGTRHE